MTIMDPDFDRFVRACDGRPPVVDRWAGWAALAKLAAVCAAALLLFVGPLSDVDIAGGSGQQSFDEWYAHPENARWYEFQQWYGASPRNAGYYHVRDHFGPGRVGDQAVRVALCESNLQPRASSPTNDHGILQINAVHRRQFEQVTGVAWNPNVYHADANATYGRWLYEQQGWAPWTCQP